MRKIRTIATVGEMSIAALGLVGAGAHAVFTTITSSTQTIIAGTPSVVTWASDASNACDSEANAITYDFTSGAFDQ